MDASSGPRALLLDALGTLVRLEPPAPLLAERLGIPLADAGRAVKAEIAFYRANIARGRDAAGLADLRRDCARIVRDQLGLDAPLDAVEADLLASLRFTAYPEVPGALRRWRAEGRRLVVVSNWDVSLHEVLEATGLRALIDGAVSSAEIGAAKPDPAPVRRALELAGAAPGEAWLVGDSPAEDVPAARAAGVEPVLVLREDGGAPGLPDVPLPGGVRTVASLDEL